MGSPAAIMELLALTLLVAVASAVPSQQWRKADPLFEHSLTTRNMFSNPLHTVFGVQAKKVLEESRQAILGKSYAPRQPYKGKRPEDCSLENMPSGDKIINGMEAADNQFPWVVYLRCNNPGRACTASMISDTWVLTAAHCVDGCTEWTVQAGSNLINGQDDSRVTIDTMWASATRDSTSSPSTTTSQSSSSRSPCRSATQSVWVACPARASLTTSSRTTS